MDLFESFLLNTPFNRYIGLFNRYMPYINHEKCDVDTTGHCQIFLYYIDNTDKEMNLIFKKNCFRQTTSLLSFILSKPLFYLRP